MAGEMTNPVDEEKWHNHALLRDLVDGKLRAFDQYQGPYVKEGKNKYWLIPHRDGSTTLYNERTDTTSDTALDPTSYMDDDQFIRHRLSSMLEEIQ